eukprot:Pgem_evm1s17444
MKFSTSIYFVACVVTTIQASRIPRNVPGLEPIKDGSEITVPEQMVEPEITVPTQLEPLKSNPNPNLEPMNVPEQVVEPETTVPTQLEPLKSDPEITVPELEPLQPEPEQDHSNEPKPNVDNFNPNLHNLALLESTEFIPLEPLKPEPGPEDVTQQETQPNVDNLNPNPVNLALVESTDVAQSNNTYGKLFRRNAGATKPADTGYWYKRQPWDTLDVTNFPGPKTWPDNKIFYTFHHSTTDIKKQWVKKALKIVNEDATLASCLTFTEFDWTTVGGENKKLTHQGTTMYPLIITQEGRDKCGASLGYKS